jgi:hypothetical protein
MQELFYFLDYYILPYIRLVSYILVPYFIYKVSRNLRSILKELCHIGKKIKK